MVAHRIAASRVQSVVSVGSSVSFGDRSPQSAASSWSGPLKRRLAGTTFFVGALAAIAPISIATFSGALVMTMSAGPALADGGNGGDGAGTTPFYGTGGAGGTGFTGNPGQPGTGNFSGGGGGGGAAGGGAGGNGGFT